MASKDDIIDTLIGLIVGGRGSGTIDPGFNPYFDVPTFREAIAEDRRRGKQVRTRVKRGATKAQKAYGRAFKRLAPKFKKKNGSWKKDGFKRCVKAAHKDCRSKHKGRM